ncbi:MAG: hypothetical protein JO362_15070 [Streptomycetaceae bacterium]|nr:hypothetical protein [Streptomycetaceae bacterium]
MGGRGEQLGAQVSYCGDGLVGCGFAGEVEEAAADAGGACPVVVTTAGGLAEGAFLLEGPRR